MKITPLTEKYYDETRAVVAQAFAQAAHTDGDEANLIGRLRKSATYHPDYDAIALNDDNDVVGHAMLSQALIDNHWPVFVLAPLAVRPDTQNQGVGGALITYLEVQAGEDERRAISILGDPAYYGRFGYQPAAQFGITPPAGIPSDYFLIKALIPGGLANVSGQLTYDAAFGIA